MCKCNESVSSEQVLDVHESDPAAEDNLYDSVSNEEADTGAPADDELVEGGTEESAEGGLEDVEGFSPTHALNEGLKTEEVQISQELADLPPAGKIEFGAEFAESVCGADGRIRINATARYPWRAICQLIITMANGRRSRCTGWFIGPRTVMTSGHCVYSHSAGGWARQIEVITGMNAGIRPYGSQVSRSFRSVRGWTKSRNSDFDYGCVVLPNKVLGNRVGWFGFASYSSGKLDHMLVNNSGYAGDKPFGTQWYNAGKITKVTSRKLEYMIDTYGGHSGSPVWRYIKGKGRYAVGIHGYGGCPNKAVRIVKPVFRNMLKWKNL
ncbi:MAG: serine protease [Bacteroidota bacterium]